MKKTLKKLTLFKETLRMLTEGHIETAAGAVNSGTSCPVCEVTVYRCPSYTCTPSNSDGLGCC